MEKSKGTRGGFRPGSGAKRLGDQKRVNFVCRVDPGTMNRIKQLSEDCGMSRGEVIDRIIKWYVEDSNKEG